MIDVRRARPEDLEAIRAIYRSASLSNEGDRDALLAHPEVLLWPDVIAAGHTRVAVDGHGTVRGFATARPTGHALELDDLFVDPDSRRRGTASVLVAFIALDGVQDGRSWIDVTGNEHAAAFYASADFVRTGEVETAFGTAPRLRLNLVRP